MFIIGTDTFLISPLLPVLSNMYGIDTAISGWLVSAYAIGYAIFALFSGPISDGHNRKKVMIYGLIGFMISTLLCSFSYNFQLMLLFRFLAGVSASFVTPQVWASIPIVIDKEHIVKVMGYATAGLSVSQMLGVPIGGYLANISWHTPFWCISFCTLVLLILIYIFLPNLELRVDNRLSFVEAYKNILIQKKPIKYLMAYFIFQTGSFTAITFIPTWYNKIFNLDLTAISTAIMIIGIGNLSGSLFGSTLVKKYGLQKIFKIELITLSLLYIILPFSPNIFIAEFLLILIYLCNGFIFPLLMTTLQSTVKNARSTISSLSNAAMYLGETLSGILGGVLFANFSGFIGVALFSSISLFSSMIIYNYSGAFSKQV